MDALGGRHVRALPLAGLVVMVATGILAGPYTPSWFDGTPPCTRFSAPCPVDVDPQEALRALSWALWGGLVLVVAGAGLAAGVLARREPRPGGPAPGVPGATRLLEHAALAGVVTAVVVTVGGWASLFAGPASSGQLALATATATWLGLGRVLERAGRGHGRPGGPATAYLLSLTVAGLSVLALASVLVAGHADAWWAAVAAAAVTAALTTAITDVVPWQHRPGLRAVGGVVVTGAAVAGLVGSLSLLGLLHPPAPPTAGADRAGTTRPDQQDPAQPTAPLPTPSSPHAATSPATPDPGVRTARRCAADDLRLELTGFDAAMGARVASLEASNLGEKSCYVDGFATVSLSQGGSRLDVRSGTTSTRQPGMPGRPTRVGLAPRHTARATLYWRGFGAAADTTTPQTLTVTLHPGSSGRQVDVEPYAFDLADGGELRVGNWVLAG